MLFLEVGVDIPRVPLLGLVDEGLQQVAADRVLRSAGIGFCRSQGFRAAPLVEQAGHATRLRIDLHADELVLKRVRGCLQQSVHGNSVRRSPAHEISLISERRSTAKAAEIAPGGFRDPSRATAFLPACPSNRPLRYCGAASGSCTLNLGDVGPRPREGIEQHHRHAVSLRVDVGGNLAQRPRCHFVGCAVDILQIALGVQIIHRDPRPRHDVVKVIEQTGSSKSVPCRPAGRVVRKESPATQTSRHSVRFLRIAGFCASSRPGS